MLQFTQTLTNHELSRIGLSNAKARHKLDTGIIHGQAQVQIPNQSEPKSIRSESQLQIKLEATCLFFWTAFLKILEGMGESKAARYKPQVPLDKF